MNKQDIEDALLMCGFLKCKPIDELHQNVYQLVDKSDNTNLIARILEDNRIRITDGRATVNKVYYEGIGDSLFTRIAGYRGNLGIHVDTLK